MNILNNTAVDVQGLSANNEATETGTISNVQVTNREEESTENTEYLYLLRDKDFFKGLLDKQATREQKVMVIDLLRDIWEYFEYTQCLDVYEMSDKTIEFLQQCFTDPLFEVTEEVSKELGYESLEDRLWNRIGNALGRIANRTADT